MIIFDILFLGDEAPGKEKHMSEKFAMCNHNHQDCFAYFYGVCLILNDQIRKPKCPFYKTREEFINNVPQNDRIDDVVERISR